MWTPRSTIPARCAGRLEIRYKNPRKNTVKVLLLMDSGGSMDYYSGLCSQLFQAATKSNHFKELHTYYFHNCIYGDVYNGPRLWSGRPNTYGMAFAEFRQPATRSFSWAMPP